MREDIMACFGGECFNNEHRYYDSSEERKLACMRNKQITRLLKEQHKQDLRTLKILLLGTGESGKSTITKQMKIIHINGFDTSERIEKICNIRRNIKESIVIILCAMQQLDIALELEENKPKMDYIIQEAANPDMEITDEFLDYAQTLWEDAGVKECFSRNYEYQLIDSAKYFLDKISEIRQPDYIPSDKDILRCRVLTTSIQHIEFEVPDAGHPVSFRYAFSCTNHRRCLKTVQEEFRFVYDVGGQRGERKKWIQVFDSVVAILFLADCSSYDQTLREDRTTNRFLEALEIFEQVWRNRFLKNVSILLFMNKMDILAEKVERGRYIKDFADRYPDKFPSYDKFTPSSDVEEFTYHQRLYQGYGKETCITDSKGSEKLEFLDSYNTSKSDGEIKKRRGSRSGSKSADVNPDLVKNAVYIKHLFMKIVKGDIVLKPTVQELSKDWHHNHSCEYFYTCAIDTNNIQRVLTGCRNLIIRKHLERFGII